MDALRRKGSGFTLVELMIVVVIIGVLAAIAIPAFSRYIKKSRTAEAGHHVNKMFLGSVTYYETDHMDNSIPPKALPKQFPSTGLDVFEPGPECGCQAGAKCPGSVTTWGDATWVALNFSVPDPHSYRSHYKSTGAEALAVFTSEAIGDLDCDTILATFRRVGGVDTVTGSVAGGTAPVVINELE